MQYTIAIPLKAYFPRNAKVRFLEECLEKYFNHVTVEPQPGNLPAKQTPIRRFFDLEYTEYLDYDDDDEKKFRAKTGFCTVDLIEYLEKFPKELSLLKPYYIRYNGYTNRDSYRPLLMALYRKVDLHELHRMSSWV